MITIAPETWRSWLMSKFKLGAFSLLNHVYDAQDPTPASKQCRLILAAAFLHRNFYTDKELCVM